MVAQRIHRVSELVCGTATMTKVNFDGADPAPSARTCSGVHAAKSVTIKLCCRTHTQTHNSVRGAGASVSCV